MIHQEKTHSSLGPFGRGAAAFLLAFALAAPAWAQGLRAETVTAGLEHPWAVAFLPGGRFLVTERPGRMRVIEADGKLGPPVAGVPEVVTGGQAGLFDVVPDSGFASNRTIYFCYAEPGPGGNGTALAKAKLADDARKLEDVKVIFRQRPKVSSQLHFGCRIAEARDGNLFLAMGERFSRRDQAQLLDNDLGKIVRLTRDGAPAPGNPFMGKPGALAEIWSYGHRNPQGLAIAPDGALWETEHGPQGGDEANVILPGRNYGWPVISYGEEYGGGPVGAGIAQKEGMEQPLHHWTPSIATSGMAFVTSDRYGPAMKGSLVVGSLKFRHLARLTIANGKVANEARVLDVGQRVRDVRQGPDGLLYLVTDESNGRLVRVLPR